MSEEKKKGGGLRFNLLDLALILLAILCVVSIVFRGDLRRVFEEGGVYQTHTVIFAAEDLPVGAAELLTAGTVLYVEHDGTRCALGTLNDNVSTTPVGTDRVNVQGALRCMILRRDDAYYLKNGPDLALNMQLSVESETTAFRLVIVSIEKNS